MVGHPGGRTSSEQCRGDDSPSAPRGTKRNSAVRKEQNKNASRNYRERRKQRLALLEQRLVQERGQAPPGGNYQEGATPPAPNVSHEQEGGSQTVSNPGASAVAGGAPGGSTASPGPLIPSTAEVAPSVFGDLSFDSPWPLSFDTNDPVWHLPIVRRAAASSAAPPTPSSVFEREAGNPGSGRDGGGSRHRLASSAVTLGQTSPFVTYQGQSLTHFLQPPSDSPDRGKAKGSAAASSQRQQGESLGILMGHLMSLRVPDISRVMYVKQNGLFAAILDNTLAIGIADRHLLFDDDGTSPFYRDWIESKGSVQLSEVRSKFAATPKDLQPVDIQITVEHHVYLDVIPFPSFRERALKALARDPPLLDEDELCYDISNREGLVVWGSQGNDQGMDACRPWDMRCWEPKPWFLRKYHFLAGGWDDEMWKAARWWHSMRNERIVSPVPSSAPS